MVEAQRKSGKGSRKSKTTFVEERKRKADKHLWPPDMILKVNFPFTLTKATELMPELMKTILPEIIHIDGSGGFSIRNRKPQQHLSELVLQGPSTSAMLQAIKDHMRQSRNIEVRKGFDMVMVLRHPSGSRPLNISHLSNLHLASSSSSGKIIKFPACKASMIGFQVSYKEDKDVMPTTFAGDHQSNHICWTVLQTFKKYQKLEEDWIPEPNEFEPFVNAVVDACDSLGELVPQCTYSISEQVAQSFDEIYEATSDFSAKQYFRFQDFLFWPMFQISQGMGYHHNVIGCHCVRFTQWKTSIEHWAIYIWGLYLGPAI